MKTAKILEIWKAKKWDGDYGTVYYIPLKLDNGENISLGKKKEDAFNVWDTVNYEENGEWKWKEVKVNNYQPKTFDQAAQNRGAMVGMSVKLAFEKVYNDEKDLPKAKKLAKEIFETAMELYGWWEKEKPESTENDQLPF